MDPTRQIEQARQRAAAHLEDYGRTGDPGALAAAARSWQDAARLAPPFDPTRGADLAHACVVLRTYFDRTGELWAVREAVTAGRAAARLCPRPADRVRALTFLAVALCAWHHATREPAPLSEALAVLPAAAREADTDFAGAVLCHLAVAQRYAYDDTRTVHHLTAAVATGRAACREEGPLRFTAGIDLVRNLVLLAATIDEEGPLREAEAVARWTLTLDLPTEDEALALFELAVVLSTWATRSTDTDLLRTAAATATRSVALTEDPITARLRAQVLGVMTDHLGRDGAAPRRPGPPLRP